MMWQHFIYIGLVIFTHKILNYYNGKLVLITSVIFEHLSHLLSSVITNYLALKKIIP